MHKPLSQARAVFAVLRASLLAGTLMVAACGDDPDNAAPVARAGADQIVNPRGTATLDGSQSSDAEGGTLTYSWQQTNAGEASLTVTLSGASTAAPTFSVPDVTQDTPLVFALTVTDAGNLTGTDTVTVTVNAPPTANAGEDESRSSVGLITLNGSGNDSESDTLGYSWRQTSGEPRVTLSSTTVATPTFTAPNVSEHTTLTFELTVTDEDGLSTSDSVSVRVESARNIIADVIGHDDSVRSVSVSNDGGRAVSGGASGIVHLWDASTKEEIHFGEGRRSLGRHDGEVYAVAISGDGRRAISGGQDGVVRLWDTETGEEIRRYGEETEERSLHPGGLWMYAVAIDEDGSHAAAGGFDGKVYFWDTATGVQKRSRTTHDASVYAVALSGDGSRALSGEADGDLYLWDTTSASALNRYDRNGPVFGVALSTDGEVVVAGGADNKVHVWNADGNKLYELSGHQGDVSSVSINAAKTHVLSASGDGTVRLWNVDADDSASNREIHTVRLHTDYVWSASLSNSGLVLSGGADGLLNFWDVAAPPTDTTEPFATEEHDWDPKASDDVGSAMLPNGHTDIVWGVALSADGHRALSGSVDDTVRLWDTTTGDLLHTMRGHTSDISDVALSVDGSLALSGSHDNTLRLWDAATGEHLRTMTGHTDSVCSVALSLDGRLALSGSYDNTLRLWDATTGEHLRTMSGHTGRVFGVSLSADGRLALSGAKDRSARLWDTTTGELLRTMSGHGHDVLAVSLSADGRVALLGSWHTVYLWDTATGKQLRILSGHSSWVSGVSLDADGRTALSGARDNSTRFWHFGRSRTKFVSTDISQPTDNGGQPTNNGGQPTDNRSGLTANAGRDRSARGGDRVILDGSGSTDRAAENRKPRAYSWRQTRGTSVNLSGANTAKATFTAPGSPPQTTEENIVDAVTCVFLFFLCPAVVNENEKNTARTTLTFELTVTGVQGDRDSDTVNITVRYARSGIAPPPLVGAAPPSRSTITPNVPPNAHLPSLTRTALPPNPVIASDTKADVDTVCASVNGKTGRIVRDGHAANPQFQRAANFDYNCIYPASFLDADSPLVTDMTIRALPDGGAHVFLGNLVVGHEHDAGIGLARSGDGPTLTIEPGAVLAFEGASSTLVVNRGSRLLAVGTPDKPITLTSRSAADDSVREGQWAGLRIHGGDGGDSGRLEYVVVKHAAANAGTSDVGGIELHNVASGTTVRNLQVYASDGDGLALIGGDVHVENFVAVYAQGDSIDIDGGWSGTLTNALVIQPQHGGDHCLNIRDTHQGRTNGSASGRITGLTCITSSHTAGANNLGAGIRLDANAAPVIERSLVVGIFSDDTDPRANYCLRLDNHPAQAAGDESLIRNVPALTGNIFACEDKTTSAKAEAWVAGGNNQFAEVLAPTDPTTATDTHLQLLGGTPPVYSLHYDELQVNGADTTVTPPNGADFPGAASQSTAPSWLRPDGIDWTHGIFAGSRDEPLWFEPAR